MAKSVMIEIQQMMVTTQWTPLLHSHVILDILNLEILQELVKYQETGINKHQLALVNIMYIFTCVYTNKTI